MTPMDIGISNSKSNATQYGATISGASLITGGGKDGVLKTAILGAVILVAFIAFIIIRK